MNGLDTSVRHNAPIGLLPIGADVCEDHSMNDTTNPDGITAESPIRNIAVGPNDGTWIPGAGYANGRTVAYMVAVAIVTALYGSHPTVDPFGHAWKVLAR